MQINERGKRNIVSAGDTTERRSLFCGVL